MASKWLGLKARLDEAFSNHVARFVGAAEELLKQLRMLVLSGWGPQQREHGTLVTMRIFCDFFVTCHFVKEFRFCNYGEQRKFRTYIDVTLVQDGWLTHFAWRACP